MWLPQLIITFTWLHNNLAQTRFDHFSFPNRFYFQTIPGCWIKMVPALLCINLVQPLINEFSLLGSSYCVCSVVDSLKWNQHVSVRVLSLGGSFTDFVQMWVLA